MLTLEGPAATRFVAVLRQHSGVDLTLAADSTPRDPAQSDPRAGGG